MRRFAVAAAVAVVVLLHDPVSSRAATTAGERTTATSQVATTSSSITIAGTDEGGATSTVTVDPGGTGTTQVTITNHTSADRLNVAVAAVDASVRSDNTIVADASTSNDAAGEAGSSTNGAASWVGIADTGLVLAPGASVNVPLKVHVPPEATGGVLAAVVRAKVTRASTISPDSTSKDDPTLSNASVSVGLRINVHGAQRAELSVTDVKLVRTKGERVVRVTITNQGSTSAPVTGAVDVGSPPVHLPLALTIAARRTATADVRWPSAAAASNVAVSIHHGNDNAEWSGRLDPNSSTGHADAAAVSPASTPGVTAAPSSSDGGSGGAGVPWFILAAIALALAWLIYELVAASRARNQTPRPAFAMHGIGAGAFGGSDPRLQEELEPLVAAIAALAGTIEGRSQAPWASRPQLARPHAETAATGPDTHDVVIGPAIAEIPVAVDDGSQPPRAWEPHDAVTEIREVLARIDRSARREHATCEPDPITALEPDELVAAVATALTVAPATVRHWLSDATLNPLDANTPTTVDRDTTTALVRERQVLLAEVEVLKRALSDLG